MNPVTIGIICAIALIGGAIFWYFTVAKDGAENIPESKKTSVFEISWISETYLKGWDYGRKVAITTTTLSRETLSKYKTGDKVTYQYTDEQITDVTI